MSQTTHIGNYFEYTSDGITRTTYYHVGRPVAMRVIDGQDDDLYFFLVDALGSVADMVPADDITGTTITEMVRYLPWGKAWSSPVSTTTSIDETTFHFTGQREEADIGLYDYKARWYDPQLGRFIQPDTIVPDPGDPQSLNRYSRIEQSCQVRRSERARSA
ncbi:MAG: RHS repeat-associated core domain-containing protein [Alphaproteobacteria bacterium]